MDYLHHVYEYDVIVVGGGLAGLTAALHLAQEKKRVLVIEKHAYPRHKVCGEYVSQEVLPYLSSLNIEIENHTAVFIDQLQLSDKNGKSIHTKLPLGGFGISRYAFDELLYQKAQHIGVTFLFEIVKNIVVKENTATVTTKKGNSLSAKVVLGAFGKRSNLDVALQRSFIKQKSPWLGVKGHYHYPDHPGNLVGLHNFPGGYGGISKIENGNINFCFLTSYDSFENHREVGAFLEKVVATNPILKDFLKKAEPQFERPLTIAQIVFGKKTAVVKNIPLLGDSAGMIHPLCGNGMAMAIHSAKLASECVLAYLNVPESNYASFLRTYAENWQGHFQKRLWVGRQLQRLFLSPKLSDIAISTVARSERLLRSMILQTHGQPIWN